MVTMPRSARLAAWASAWLRDQCTLDDVVARVCGDDEPHDVVDVPGAVTAVPLATALTTLREQGASAFRASLPVPGDPVGLGGPADLTEDAVDAGEAVIAENAGYALVPDIRVFGPPGDQGHLVTWRCRPANPPPSEPRLAESDQLLADTLRETGSALAKLDVASWRPEVATLLDEVRSAKAGEPLPRGFPTKAQLVAARSIRLLAVAELALDDDGGAVTAAEAESRRAVLTPLERAARHALVAACNSLDGSR
ncbi:hypothetical protein EF847_09950 [Actinobacteria bacterium YIM 96077]|uniref:Uncharacterized protein n=1 Tax=Phytoactinopolyspora halophila TaxID=1981511 RepID=A0A329QLX3_9ACTN|nr:hypothetical protein [Phytoactinopolyspora halophila]AYY12979.1 hypothetical protein EF847_09950 [Actinobacteria bacterium YIM 96077]RAW13243.1 hypothetical protein DPM12_12975 [Phytoactinopolyspora halophila]